MKRTNPSSSKNRRKLPNRRIILGILALLIVGAAWWYFVPYSNSHFKGNTSSAKKKGYSTAINKTRDGSTPLVPGGSSAQGGAIDKKGQVSSNQAPSSQWAISTSKAITLKQPLSNSTIKSGDALSGSASVDTINFRIIDNASGVIAQGSLNVVGGNFSGLLQFRPQSSSGRVDVYSYDSDGVEVNEVQIPIGLK